LNAFLAESTAERAGYIAGVVVGIGILLGVGVFAIISIVKAFTKRTTGWIVAGCVGGLLISVPVIAMLIAFIGGFTSAMREGGSARDETASGNKLPKSAATQIVRGQDIAYTLRVPNTWVTKRHSRDFDTLNSHKSLYVGIIAEESNLGNSQTIADIARAQIKENCTDIHWTDPAPLVLDGRNWLQFTADCKVDKIPVSYQFYVYSGPEGTFQVLGWTTQDLIRRDAPLMKEVMQTFRFPQ
jgi:hypothetical protein